MIGSLLAQPAKPLPIELAAFLEQGHSHGHAAIYMSMGTFGRLNEQQLRSLAEGLAGLPNPVL